MAARRMDSEIEAIAVRRPEQSSLELRNKRRSVRALNKAYTGANDSSAHLMATFEVQRLVLEQLLIGIKLLSNTLLVRRNETHPEATADWAKQPEEGPCSEMY